MIYFNSINLYKMNTLRELVNKVYTDLQRSDRVKEYPDLAEKDVVWDIIQWIALESMPNFVKKGDFNEFVDESEKKYNEETFKKYIANYPEFLNQVELEFYSWLLVWVTTK